jgi:hypothetical protein
MVILLWARVIFLSGTNVSNKADEKQGAPVTKQTNKNVMKIRELVGFDRWLTCCMVADDLHMSKETVRKILVQDLGMRKSAHAMKLDRETKGQTYHSVSGIC